MSMTWNQSHSVRRAAASTVVLVAVATSAIAQQAPVDGVWQSEDGEGRVEIGPCSANQEFRCGKIVWIKTPLADNGKPVVDAKNPDDVLKTRPICGLEILSRFNLTATGDFERGNIYDPEEGKNYAGTMKLVGDTLKISGSIDVPILGLLSGSETWTRVTTSFTRCSTVAKK